MSARYVAINTSIAMAVLTVVLTTVTACCPFGYAAAIIGDPSVAGDGSGGAYLLYQTFDWSGNRTTALQRLDSSGRTLWGSSGIVLRSGGVVIEPSPAGYVIKDSTGVIAVYNGTDGIYAQKITPQGMPTWPEAVRVSTFPASTGKFEAVGDPEGIIVAFSAGKNLFATRFNRDGKAIWPLTILSTDEPLEFETTSTSNGSALFIWTTNGKTWAQYINTRGELVWGKMGIELKPPPNLHATTGSSQIASIVAVGNQAWGLDLSGSIAWYNETLFGKRFPETIVLRPSFQIADGQYPVAVLAAGPTTLWTQIVNPVGTTIVPGQGKPVWKSETSIENLFFTKTGGMNSVTFVVWSYQKPKNDYWLQAQKLDSKAEPVWRAESMPVVSSGWGYIGRPKLAIDNEGGILICCKAGSRISDTRTIIVQKLDSSGKPRWGQDGIRL